MSYSIRYGRESKPEAQQKIQITTRWTGILVVAAALFAGILWPQGRAFFRNILFPWLDGATVAAFTDMIGQISDGAAVPAAVADFCREIIAHAGIPV